MVPISISIPSDAQVLERVVALVVAKVKEGVFGALSTFNVTACDPDVGEVELHVTPV